ncbi:hypothetical protein QBC46DRAFT_421803 [Diplogelasinospora grovesii]|uniref:Tetratricopeptide repeat protein 1 n=1 Tax=Diplogelasinospora grovesii TaxID=303347 RepID=A0AAN6MY58_9PEZI|nr:hypothetical protein QBC46DRAFT_421803 [Diplogelasinospora grovesii]
MAANGSNAGREETSEDLDEQLDDGKQLGFSPEEEASMVAESNTHKAEANTLFSSGKYDAAISKYDEALAVCPTYLDYELAVLRSNIAACHLKLEEWKEAINNATTALDGLDRLEREVATAEKGKTLSTDTDKGNDTKTKEAEDDADEAEEEIVSAGAARAGPAITKPPPKESEAEIARKKRREDIARIRAKALMRRARARSEMGGWSNLEGALEDYKKLAAMNNLALADKNIVKKQLKALPPRVETARATETAEMWNKLKELGNGILKPFGLSTEHFKMAKDEKTGGYSMNFQGGGPGGSQT